MADAWGGRNAGESQRRFTTEDTECAEKTFEKTGAELHSQTRAACISRFLFPNSVPLCALCGEIRSSFGSKLTALDSRSIDFHSNCDVAHNP
jgi:hypothetical protein